MPLIMMTIITVVVGVLAFVLIVTGRNYRSKSKLSRRGLILELTPGRESRLRQPKKEIE